MSSAIYPDPPRLVTAVCGHGEQQRLSTYCGPARPGSAFQQSAVSGLLPRARARREIPMRLRATGKIGAFTGDRSLLPHFRTSLAQACRAGTRDGWRPGPQQRSSGYFVTARRARYIPGGIWETSRRGDRTGRALIAPIFDTTKEAETAPSVRIVLAKRP